MFGVATWQVVASATYYGVFAATASIRRAFDLSAFEIGLVVTTMILGYTLFLFPAGALVDGFGDRPAMLLGIGGLGVAALGLSFVSSFPALLAMVFVLGSTYAAAMPATNRAITARSPPGRYNLAINVKQVGVTAGSAMAALLVTNMGTFGASWSRAFAVVGGLALVAAAAVFVRYDGTGGTGDLELPDIRGLRGNRPYLLLAMGGVFVGATIFATTGYMVPYFEDSGSGLQVAGLALASMQVSGSVGRIGVGGLTDRISSGDSSAAMAVMSGQLAVAAAVLVAFPVLPIVLRFPAVALLGVGLLGLTGLLHGTYVALVPTENAGAATAGGQTLINVGGLVVPPIFGLLADTAGYRVSWWLLAVLSLTGVGFMFAARRSLERINA